MSSRLSDRISQTIEANTKGGHCDTDAACTALVALLEPDEIETAKWGYCNGLIKQRASKVVVEFAKKDPRQGEMPFRVHLGYAITVETENGTERRIVNSYDMTRFQVAQALAERRKQITDDTRSANDLERAIRAAEPYWNAEPDLCFGRALEKAAAGVAVAA